MIILEILHDHELVLEIPRDHETHQALRVSMNMVYTHQIILPSQIVMQAEK